jgi:uncharacterized membrane protein YkvA (DUF1232 family)
VPRRKSKRSLQANRADSSTAPILEARDARAYLLQQALEIAPADLHALVGRKDEVLRKIASDDNPQHEIFHRQLEVSVQLLVDYDAGDCPQIPYFTVGLLTAALFYWLQPVDAIPDFIPGTGTSDDALILELACELGGAGLLRYCDWKGIPLDSVLPGQPNAATTRRRTKR